MNLHDNSLLMRRSNMTAPVAAPTDAPLETELTVDSRELLAGRNELKIVHAGAVYRLKVTGAGKLLLTK
jgi:hemin uptake protein HemP